MITSAPWVVPQSAALEGLLSSFLTPPFFDMLVPNLNRAITFFKCKILHSSTKSRTLPAFRLHSWLCWLSSLGLSNYLIVPPRPEASPERTGACDRGVVRPDAAAPAPARLRKTLHHGPGVASMGAEPTGVKAGGIGRRNGRRRGGFLLGPTPDPVVPFNPDAAPSRCPPAGRSRRTGAVGRSSVSGGRPARSGRAGHSPSRR